MEFILSDHKLIRYSPVERAIFKFLPQDDRSIDTHHLVALYFGRRKPPNAQQRIIGYITRLTEKVHLNREPFRICTSGRAGPNPSEFWVEAK